MIKNIYCLCFVLYEQTYHRHPSLSHLRAIETFQTACYITGCLPNKRHTLYGNQFLNILYFSEVSPVFNNAWGWGGTVPCILNLCKRWRTAVSFITRPLHPSQNTPWQPLGRKGWVGCRVGLDALENRKILFCQISKADSCHSAHSLVSVPAELALPLD